MCVCVCVFNMYFISYRVEARCAFESFDCAERNPCSPHTCTDGVFNYPGNWYNKYVTCDNCGGCEENVCDKKFVWDQDTQQCVPKEDEEEEDPCVVTTSRLEK